MPKGMQAIYTRTITSAGSLITFNNIPQTYTDLQLRISSRDNAAVSLSGIVLIPNGSGAALWSGTVLSEGPSSYRYTAGTYGYIGTNVGASATSNMFTVTEVIIPSYTSNLFKQVMSDGGGENNNSTTNPIRPQASLWRSNAPINALTIGTDNGQFAIGSTITLYGISR
jgi:hypothetical protein